MAYLAYLARKSDNLTARLRSEAPAWQAGWTRMGEPEGLATKELKELTKKRHASNVEHQNQNDLRRVLMGVGSDG